MDEAVAVSTDADDVAEAATTDADAEDEDAPTFDGSGVQATPTEAMKAAFLHRSSALRMLCC